MANVINLLLCKGNRSQIVGFSPLLGPIAREVVDAESRVLCVMHFFIDLLGCSQEKLNQPIFVHFSGWFCFLFHWDLLLPLDTSMLSHPPRFLVGAEGLIDKGLAAPIDSHNWPQRLHSRGPLGTGTGPGGWCFSSWATGVSASVLGGRRHPVATFSKHHITCPFCKQTARRLGGSRGSGLWGFLL